LLCHVSTYIAAAKGLRRIVILNMRAMDFGLLLGIIIAVAPGLAAMPDQSSISVTGLFKSL
jgi:hypothetical protein